MFSPENYDSLEKYTLYAKRLPKWNYTHTPYKKNWLFNQWEIDILEETTGIIAGHFRGFGWSLAVPVTNTEMIEYIDSTTPKQIYKIMKRLC